LPYAPNTRVSDNRITSPTPATTITSQSGEFGFVLFGAATTAGLMTPYGFAFSALLISLSMVVTPLLGRLDDRFLASAVRPAEVQGRATGQN